MTQQFNVLRRLALVSAFLATTLHAQPDMEDLAKITPGATKAANALWIENDLSLRFNSSRRVVVADLKGPGVITMMHFADPTTHKVSRDLLLRIYWDGETAPSVDVPMVDFFCDPAGLRQSVNTALVNKRRGFNAYFPMPFRRSAKVELVYEGTVEPGEALWKIMPCYSYVMYRAEKKIARDTGYFHAAWRQESLLLGKQDYIALDTTGQGKVVGWNVTVRSVGRNSYPVDENEKFYIDGEKEASVEFQGLEDSFGFSWGFPESESIFPMTGYFPFMNGAAAYRFFLQDAIHFDKSLRVAIGFGVNESPFFRREYSMPGSTLQFSTTVYWYQIGQRGPLPPMLSAELRAPAPDAPSPADKEILPSADDLKKRGVKLSMLCGRRGKEVVYAAPGYGVASRQGFAWNGWFTPVYYARADDKKAEVVLNVPKGAAGTVRVFVIDPDEFEGGRSENISIGGDSIGQVNHFEEGRWIEHAVSSEQTATGTVAISATNARDTSNAVLSIIEWVER
jgi:hypothetical protein